MLKNSWSIMTFFKFIRRSFEKKPLPYPENQSSKRLTL